MWIMNNTILGIDPGSERCGWGIIQKQGRNIKVLDYGCIVIPKGSDRLSLLKKELTVIIIKNNPDEATIEKIFFFKNKKTIIDVSQARGVAILCLQENSIPYSEYTPLQIKQTTTGYGRANKKQMIKMIKIIFNLPDSGFPDDAYDALAAAYTHICFKRLII